MNKPYVSPEIECHKITLNADILTVSDPQGGASSGSGGGPGGFGDSGDPFNTFD